MKIAICSSEVFPFAKTGGLGDVCGSLPLALEEIGVEVSVFLPAYRCVREAGHSLEQMTDSVSKTMLGKNVAVYFIEHEKFFDRNGLYGDGSGDYPDNLERFSHYCDRTLALLKPLNFQPDVVHCHDWQTALIPVYLKEKYGEDGFYTRIKTLLTIHNLAFQGVFPTSQYPKLGLDKSLLTPQGFEFHDQVNLLKAGIIYSDRITTVSPRYSNEIQTKQFGCGLEDVLGGHNGGITGILNGLDHTIWNPAADEFIAEKYSADDFDDAKLANKMQLQKELRLEVRDDIPLFGFVGRLSHQKGLDLVFETLDDLLKMDVQMVFLGVGDGQYQKKLEEIAGLYPDNIAVCFEFNEPLGHKIYAGSDLFLMPSRFEPCGLSQMISLRYGTIPVAFKTGGLADTITPFGLWRTYGNGFVFTKYTAGDFLNTVKKAVKVFRNEKRFHRLRTNAFDSEFSWKHSANQYRDIYQCL